MTKPRVLIVAEACNPEWVSVPLVGWSQFNALRQYAQCHLVTQIRNRDAIERTGMIEGRDFTAIDSEAAARPAYRLAALMGGKSGKAWTFATALSAITYPYFEYLIWRQFKAALRRGEFDIVHRITPLSPTTPSLLARRCAKIGIPFIVGPLNGGVPWPRGFDKERRKEGEWLSYVRGVHKFLPGYRNTRRYASAILIGSRDTWNQMPARYLDKCLYLPENGIEPDRFTACRSDRANIPLRAIFVGRLVPYKGADMLIEAAASLIQRGMLTLEIIGDGPQRSELERLVVDLKLGSGVQFSGWVQHHDVQHHLAKADLLTFPSIREFGGGVVLEAMAVGLVPVIVDYGGPAELVTESTGYSIPMGKRKQIIAAFRAVLDHLTSNPTEIDQKSPLARQRVMSLFTWPQKAKFVGEVYRWVLGARADKPSFGTSCSELSPAAADDSVLGITRSGRDERASHYPGSTTSESSAIAGEATTESRFSRNPSIAPK